MTSKSMTSLLKLAVTIGLFYIIFTQVEIGSVVDEFSELVWYWALCVMFVYQVRLVMQTVRWKILLKDHGADVPFWVLFKRNWIGHFVSNFLPGRVGGDIYRIFGHMEYAVEKPKLASSVILDRLIGILALLAYVCIAGVLQASTVMQTGMEALIAASALGILLVVPWFMIHAPGQWLLKVSNRLPDGKLKNKLLSLINALIEGTRKKRTMVYAFFISIAFHVLGAVGSYFSMRAVGFEVSLVSVILIIPLVNLIAEVPIALNGLGLREGAFTLMFTAVGVPAAVSVSAALLDRLVVILMSLVGGVMYQSQLSKIGMNKATSPDEKMSPARQAGSEKYSPEIDLSRVILFGPRASGKSTVSRQLATHLNLAHVEFDAIRRKNDGTPADETDYTRTLTELVQQPRWIMDGDYLEGVDRLAMPIVWPHGTTAIWLDLPFLVTMRRLVARAYRRVVHKEPMWNGMRESKSSFLKRVVSGNAVRAYWSAKKAYPVLLQKPEYSHLTILHLKTQADIEQLLSSAMEGRKC